MTATAVAPAADYTFSPQQLTDFKAAAGFWNIASVSGGRILNTTDGLILPIRYGYQVRVRVICDTFTVQRLFVRGSKTTVKGERTDVYADEIGEAIYRAGCYHDEF